ncbi:MAG: hypothetical protein ACJAXQ_001466 [Parvibaculaceae bacterium]|jgi:hypothetical protein|tara:strand:+ start:134 stop:574 length:441 start_codon:yes stop_codon:yes gene_type:complete
MMKKPKIPNLDIIKDQAKRLRTTLLEANGEAVSHSQSLEILAHQYGFKDWNVLHAAIGNRPPECPVEMGDHVSGRYLSQEFEAEVRGIETLGPDRYRLTLHFDKPVDVVTFESFSAMRQRVHCNVDASGKTIEKTSDGRSQVQLHL